MLTRANVQALRKAQPDAPNKLRIAMALAGLTQVQVAEAMGILQSQVSKDAAGKFSDIALGKARAYADLFGCSIEDLFPAHQTVNQ